jgi:CRISPR/Cas system endoribonuclease Cas6 (RAMP superfamily)
VADSLQNLAAHEADGRAWAAAVAEERRPIHRLRVRFLSPLQVKLRGKVAGKPEFLALARAVVRRLRILSVVHGNGSWPQEEYGPLLDLAETVSLEHHETTWLRHARYSARGGAMPMEGLVGEAWYASDEDLLPLLPALWLGQWVHVGKAAVWGMGRYEIHVD